MIAARFILAAVVVLAPVRQEDLSSDEAADRRGARSSALFLFLGFVPQNIGLTMTTASKSAFITGMMVVFVPLLQFIIEKRPPKIGNIVGVLLVGVGLWFLTSPAGSEFNVGDCPVAGLRHPVRNLHRLS